MNYNLHTHTYRCNHAKGSDEEYVKIAIEKGIKRLGFSDHIPLVREDGIDSFYRIPVSLASDYIENLAKLKLKYKNQIDIKIGFEMEYYPNSFKKMLNSAIELGAEYLILGQHFLNEEYLVKNGITTETDDIKVIEEYLFNVISGIKSGVFTYVAHPDIINFIGDSEIYEKYMKKLCLVSKEYDVPLEINFIGIRKGRHYPNKKFWEIAGKIKSPVTFGCDAHSPNDVYDENSLSIAKELVKEFNLNYVGEPKIVLLATK